MVRIGKIASLVMVAWLVYGLLLYLDARDLLPLHIPFFVTFYGVALVLGTAIAFWDKESPVLSAFAVGFLSVFQWGYLMTLWQAAKGYFIYGSTVPGTLIFLMPLTFALITGAVSATAGFVLFIVLSLIRGGRLVPGFWAWRAVSSFGSNLGFIAGAWVLVASPLFLSGWLMDSPSIQRLSVLLLCLVSSIAFFAGAGLAKSGRHAQGGILLMGWGAALAGGSLLLLPFLPSSTLVATLPGLLAIAAGASLYRGTRLLARASTIP